MNWIDVKFAKPKCKGHYLCRIRDIGLKAENTRPAVFYYDDEAGGGWYGDGKACQVVAWMPIPDDKELGRAPSNAVDDCGCCSIRFNCSLSPHYNGPVRKCRFWHCAYEMPLINPPPPPPSHVRYQNDPTYHAAVDAMMGLMGKRMTPADVLDAAGLAVTVYEMSLVRNNILNLEKNDESKS